MIAESIVFTTEPAMSRALAAEIRAHPERFESLVADRLGLPLPPASAVECEVVCGADARGRRARIDLLVTFGDTRVGIEAKFDHLIHADQLEAERRAVDHLLLLVVDQADADGFRGEVDGVLTWRETLDCFADSRVSLLDVEAQPDVKRIVRRRLRAIAGQLQQILPSAPEWHVDLEDDGGGVPALAIRSPRLPSGRELRGQVHAAGRGTPSSVAEAEFEYLVGVEVRASAEDFPSDTVLEPPRWIAYLDALDAAVLAERRAEFLVSPARARDGGKGPARNKIPLAKKFLGHDRLWLVKGYADWALGIKSVKLREDGLNGLGDAAARILRQWFAACAELDQGGPSA